uniref:Uncharacterized protein n=1 Tax=Glossina morsitans morsitans TaxID=37546 RepID=A0ABK9NG64_GLOMM
MWINTVLEIYEVHTQREIFSISQFIFIAAVKFLCSLCSRFRLNTNALLFLVIFDKRNKPFFTLANRYICRPAEKLVKI